MCSELINVGMGGGSINYISAYSQRLVSNSEMLSMLLESAAMLWRTFD